MSKRRMGLRRRIEALAAAEYAHVTWEPMIGFGCGVSEQARFEAGMRFGLMLAAAEAEEPGAGARWVDAIIRLQADVNAGKYRVADRIALNIPRRRET